MTQTFEQAWDAKIGELEKITDNLGTPIDAGIIQTVAALNLLGFRTSGSCEGHNPWGCPWPWVFVEAPDDMPEFRWEGEGEARQVIMAELGLTEQDFLPGIRTRIARKEYNQQRWDWVHKTKPRETEAYQVWQEAFHQDYLRLRGLIRQFEAQSPSDLWLEYTRYGLNTWARLEFVDAWTGRDMAKSAKHGEAEADADVQIRLEARQARMWEFTVFLREKIQSGNDETERE